MEGNGNMRKISIQVIGMILCLVLFGCAAQGDDAKGDNAHSLQNMTVDIPEQDGFGGIGERVTVSDMETVGIGTSEADRNAPEATAGMTEGNNTDKTQSVEPDTAVISNRDLEEIKEYLAQFPNTLQELSETECYVIRHGIEHSGREYLNAFIDNMKAEEPGELVFVQFTTEGAPILTYLNYNGEDVYCVEDISRDGFAGGNGERYFEKYYDSIWVTANTDAEGSIYLSLGVLWEEDMALDLFTAQTEEALWYGLPPWAKPPAP